MEEEFLTVWLNGEKQPEQIAVVDIQVRGNKYRMYEYQGGIKIVKVEGGNITIQPSSDNAIKLN